MSVLFCLDLNPGFITSHLYQTGGLPNIFSGCSYKSVVNLNEHTYYLLNDTLRINSSDISELPSRRRRNVNDPELTVINFPRLEINRYNLEGSFQCVLYDEGRMSGPVYSTKTIIKLPGLYIIRIPKILL